LRIFRVTYAIRHLCPFTPFPDSDQLIVNRLSSLFVYSVSGLISSSLSALVHSFVRQLVYFGVWQLRTHFCALRFDLIRCSFRCQLALSSSLPATSIRPCPRSLSRSLLILLCLPINRWIYLGRSSLLRRVLRPNKDCLCVNHVLNRLVPDSLLILLLFHIHSHTLPPDSNQLLSRRHVNHKRLSPVASSLAGVDPADFGQSVSIFSFAALVSSTHALYGPKATFQPFCSLYLKDRAGRRTLFQFDSNRQQSQSIQSAKLHFETLFRQMPRPQFIRATFRSHSALAQSAHRDQLSMTLWSSLSLSLSASLHVLHRLNCTQTEPDPARIRPPLPVSV
jgi:hypothetical protein